MSQRTPEKIEIELLEELIQHHLTSLWFFSASLEFEYSRLNNRSAPEFLSVEAPLSATQYKHQKQKQLHRYYRQLCCTLENAEKWKVDLDRAYTQGDYVRMLQIGGKLERQILGESEHLKRLRERQELLSNEIEDLREQARALRVTKYSCKNS